MNFIYTFHFLSALIVFGLMMYMFNPIVLYLREMFPVSGPYATVVLFLFSILGMVNLFVSGIRLIAKAQER